MNDEPKSYAKIVLKKSSSTGKVGMDVEVKAMEGVIEENLDKLVEMALKSALKGYQEGEKWQ